MVRRISVYIILTSVVGLALSLVFKAVWVVDSPRCKEKALGKTLFRTDL